MRKIILFFMLFMLSISFSTAKIFTLNDVVSTPSSGCSIFGCIMQGDIDMNGYTLYNVTIVNASVKEFDPIFTAQNMSIWSAINDKYNASNPAGYITSANITDNWVNITGDTMTGNLNMSNNNITDVDVLFVHNISGRSPINIMSQVISNNSITASTFYGDIQGNNGTIYGVTITNGTITNLHVNDSALFNTSLIPEENNTWDLGSSPNNYWRFAYIGNISSPVINNLYSQITQVNNSIKQPIGPYLAYNTTNFWINESALNNTINNISKVRPMSYTLNITGVGSILSSINISYEITQIIVIPGSNTTNYRFTLTEYPSGDVIDEDRAVHKGVWNIRKSFSLNSIVNATIVTSTPSDTYSITIKYLQNGVQ